MALTMTTRRPWPNVKQVARVALGRLGYDPIPLPLSTRAERILDRGLSLAGPINTVIDVGASNGSWSLGVLPKLPHANFLLFEAAPFHAPTLKELDDPRLSVEFNAASDHVGEVNSYLDPTNPNGGGASAVATQLHSERVSCTRIDTAVKTRGLAGPYLLKLDAQGHEIEIFNGASNTLKDTALLWVEIYVVGEPGRPPFDEICAELRKLGFAAAGIADVLTRPSDGMLWQMDMLFLPTSHPAFSNSSFWK